MELGTLFEITGEILFNPVDIFGMDKITNRFSGYLVFKKTIGIDLW